MSVLFFYQHFWPDSPPYANMLRVIGAGLAASGERVGMLTAQPSYKAGDRVKRSRSHESLDGIEVRRLPPLPLTDRFTMVRKLGKALFPLRACLAVLVQRLRGQRYAVIVAATIPPVANGLFGLLAARLSGAKFVYHLQDIYPEIGAVGGLWKPDSLRHRVLLALDTFTTRHADRCVVLSDDMRDALVARGLDGANVVTINNFMLGGFATVVTDPQSSAESATPLSSKRPVASPGVRDGLSESQEISEARRALGGTAARRVVFAGNLGRFQGLEALLDAFLCLDHQRIDLDLHFLGEGVMSETLAAQATGCSRVYFHGHLPFEAASRLIAACDAGVVSIQPDVYRYAYPSKTLTYLGLGVPLLAIVEQESALARNIERHRLGVVCAEGTAAGLTHAFEALVSYLDGDDASPTRIRAYAANTSSAEVALDRWKALTDDLETSPRAVSDQR